MLFFTNIIFFHKLFLKLQLRAGPNVHLVYCTNSSLLQDLDTISLSTTVYIVKGIVLYGANHNI